MSTIEVVCAIIAIGVLSGLRALSPIAVVCWLALLHRLPVTGWASFVGSKVAVGLFSLGAVGELISDKLPKTPSRLKQPGFSIRIVMGGSLRGGVGHCGVVLFDWGGAAGRDRCGRGILSGLFRPQPDHGKLRLARPARGAGGRHHLHRRLLLRGLALFAPLATTVSSFIRAPEPLTFGAPIKAVLWLSGMPRLFPSDFRFNRIPQAR